MSNETLAYLFDKYNKNKDNREINDLVFIKIITLISGLKCNKYKINELNNKDKDFIIDSSYRYLYDNISSLRGPLMNIYGEILNDSDKPIHIKPYMELIQIIINSKDNINNKTL